MHRHTHTYAYTHICIHTHTLTHTYRAFACATTMTATEHHCYVMLQEFAFLSQLFLSNNLFSHGFGFFSRVYITSGSGKNDDAPPESTIMWVNFWNSLLTLKEKLDFKNTARVDYILF